jgi:cytochrome P450
VESWRAIYGHAPPGQKIAVKSEFYEIYGAGFRELCIGSERDPSKHAGMRKMLSSAFSQRALLEAEELVANTIDLFIRTIGDIGSAPEGLNMTKWYEMVSFDILGEMAFGESFGSIESRE